MSKIKFIQVEPTTRCNFNCVFCCGRSFKQQDMKYEVFTKVVDSFKEVLKYQIQGEGEPLLHPQFFDMVAYAKNAGKKVQTISNGSLFTRENIVKLIKSGIDVIYVSVEAPNAELYKEFRGGDFNRLVENLKMFMEIRKELNSATPVIGFAVTILKKTKRMFKDIIELYNEIGMDGGITYHFLNKLPFYQKYYNEEMEKNLVSMAETKLLIHENDDLLASMNVVDHSGNASTETYNNMGSCAWLDHGLYVSVDGFAMRCSFDKEHSEFNYGNILECTAEQIEARKAEFVCEKIMQPPTLDCHKCHVFKTK